MATTNSLVTAVNQTYFNNFMADDGTTHRIRDGQTFIGTAFGNLAVPGGATINGIIVELEGQAIAAGHDAAVGDWIYVSNDGGSSFSTAQSVTTGTWSEGNGSGTYDEIISGGLHIQQSSSGGTANTGADDFVIESSGDTGMSILSGTSSNGFIFFADSGDDNIAGFDYDHQLNKLNQCIISPRPSLAGGFFCVWGTIWGTESL